MHTYLLWLGVIVVAAMVAGDILLLVFLVAAVRNSAPAVMTPPRVMQAVLAALELPEEGRLIEPGCGDGRLLRAAVARRPKLRVAGVDNNPVLVMMAKWRLRSYGEVRLGDMLKMDLGRADRVFLYLSEATMVALEPKLERELKPGAKVVSMHYRLPSRAPARMVEVTGAPEHARRLYIYEY